MRVLLPYLLAAGFVLLMFFLWKLALHISNHMAKKEILSYGKASEETVAALIGTHFGASNVITNCHLPYRTKKGTAYTEIDCIVLLRGAVAVIEVKSLVGTIHNPDTGTWHQSVTRTHANRQSESKEIDFINPIEQNERHLSALVGIFEKEKLVFDPNPIGFVVFTSPKATFTFPRQEGIYNLPELMRELRLLQIKCSPFSASEKWEIRRAIRRHTVSARHARLQNAKLRHR